MTKSYSTLKTALQTKLNSILGQDDEALFEGVYLTNETDVEGFPVAFIVEVAGSGELLDTHRNEREWQFQIIIHHEIGRKDPADASDSIIDAVDKVMQSFDQDPMLLDTNDNAQCKYTKVVPIDIDFGTREIGYSRAVLQVSIVDLVNRYS